MGVFVYQLAIIGIICIAALFGRGARRSIVIAILIFTVFQIFVLWLGILQFITIIIGYLLSEIFLYESKNNVSSHKLEKQNTSYPIEPLYPNYSKKEIEKFVLKERQEKLRTEKFRNRMLGRPTKSKFQPSPRVPIIPRETNKEDDKTNTLKPDDSKIFDFKGMELQALKRKFTPVSDISKR